MSNKLIGYARVSTSEQDLALQLDALDPSNRKFSAPGINADSRDLFGFFGDVYALKEHLRRDPVVGQKVEDAINADPDVWGLAIDLGNLAKHGSLNRPPRSGAVPEIGERSGGDLAGGGWRLRQVMNHKGQKLDGLATARQAIDAISIWLSAQGLT